MNKKEAKEFKDALNRLCGKASEAILHSTILFDGEDLSTVKRELARCMEIIDLKVISVLKKKYPENKYRY